MIDYSRIRVRKSRLRKDLSDLSQFGKEPGGAITLDLRSLEKTRLDFVRREIGKMLHLVGKSEIETLNAKGA
jgi:hypothetical protein